VVIEPRSDPFFGEFENNKSANRVEFALHVPCAVTGRVHPNAEKRPWGGKFVHVYARFSKIINRLFEMFKELGGTVSYATDKRFWKSRINHFDCRINIFETLGSSLRRI
jgi:hypothetical protein